MTLTRGRQHRGVTMLALLLVVVAVASAACAGDTTHFSGVLDSLKIPSGWHLAKQKVESCWDNLGVACPHAVRYYQVDWGDPLPDTKALATAAGFTIDPRTDYCAFGACGFSTSRGRDELVVDIFYAGMDDTEAVIKPGPVVRLNAQPGS